MGLLARIRQFFDADPSPGPLDDFWYGSAGGRSVTGSGICEATSLQSVGVWSCVRLISEALASLPLHVYERLPNGGKRAAKDHPLYATLHDSPNENQTSMEFWETEIAHVLVWGNAYARQYFDPKENVEELEILTPDRMRVFRDRETDVKVFAYRRDDGTEEPFTESEILHIPGLGFDGLKGYSPIQMLAQSLGLSQATEEYAARFFGNSAVPGGYISHPTKLSAPAQENLRKSWSALHQGLRNAHKMGVLEEGMEIKTVALNHQDIQFLELRKFQLEEIARIFRVPLHLIQSLDRSTNNNIEHQAIDFVQHTIRPWAVRIEKRLNKSLFGPRESQRYFCEFNLDGLLRGDAKSRADFYASLRTNGAITANEIRALENMNPHPNPYADELFIQGAMVPLGETLNEQQPAEVTK